MSLEHYAALTEDEAKLDEADYMAETTTEHTADEVRSSKSA